MGGQKGGMRNEAGRFPEVCKKSMQAMAADMRGRIEPRLFETYSIDQLRSLSSRELEALGRLVDPVILAPGDDHYRTISWENALDHIAEALKGTQPERAFFYASGRSSSEAGFLMQLFARAYGTNHVNNCSFYCHQASGVGLRDSIGSPTATIELDDLEKCDLVFLIGANPASNHPRLMTELMRVRARGGHVIVVNPLREPGLIRFKVPSNLRSMVTGSEIASIYVQPVIGGDIALFAGIAKRLIARGEIDGSYIESLTDGFEQVRSQVASLSWPEIEKGSGVDRGTIDRVADQYGRSRKTVFAWTMGITHHDHGVENVQWIANLALLRGMVGKEGTGLLPIRGHSNVQGMGSVGVYPGISKAAIEGLGTLGIPVPTFQGYDTMAAMEASGRGEMSFAFCLGGNLYGANPDSRYMAEAMARLDTVVYLSTSLNTGHVHGVGKSTLILPVLARDEEPQSTTQESMFSYVRLSDGGPSRYAGPRSETEILSVVAHRTLADTGKPPVHGVDSATALNWGSLGDHDEIRRLIARLVPNLDQIKDIGSTRREFTIPGRVMHSVAREHPFPTPNGRAAFRAHPLPSPQPLDYHQVRLMTIRSEGQFNTVVYETEDSYRGQERRDVILMNPDDIARMGLVVDQPVEVRSLVGAMTVLVRECAIATGCAAMYYPEANVLVSRSVDVRSKTPAFKSTVVTISAASTGVDRPVAGSELNGTEKNSRGTMRAC